MIRQPRLMDDGLAEVRRLSPVRSSLNLKITPLSYASLELLPEDAIPPRSYVEMFTESGSAGIFRAKAPQDGFGDLTISVELEHAITELGDYLVHGKLEEETTVRAAFVKLFSYCGTGHWQLGNFTADDPVVLQAEYNTVLQAMLSVLDQAPAYMMTFDFSTMPWTVSLARRDTEVTAEGRLSRNIKTARITRDDTELCTRVYLDGLPGSTETNPGYIDADTLPLYGVVEREISGSSDLTEAQCIRMANLYLAKHKAPTIGVEISGLDLSAVTGEPLDAFRLGKKLRLAIEGEGAVVEETITALSYNNLTENPEDVTITLAAEEDTVVTALHKQDTTGGQAGAATRKASRKTQKKQEQLETEFQREYAVLDEHNNILRQAGLRLDANGLLYYATDYQNNLTAYIQSTAGALVSEIRNTVSGLTTRLEQTDQRVGMVVGTTHGEDGDTYFIKSGEIALAINNDGSTDAIINADHINIGSASSKVTLGDSIGILNSGIYFKKDAAFAAGHGLALPGDGYFAFGSQSIRIANLLAMIKTAEVSSDGKTLTLTKFSGDVINFRKAAGKVSGSWSGGTYTVISDDNGQNLPISTTISGLYRSSLTLSDSHIYTVGCKVLYTGTDGNYHLVGDDEYEITVDARTLYNDAFTAGKNSVSLGYGTATGNIPAVVLTSGTGVSKITVTLGEPTIYYNSDTHSYYIRAKAYAGDRVMDDETWETNQVAYNDGYSTGYTAGQGAGAATVGVGLGTSPSGTTVIVPTVGGAEFAAISVSALPFMYNAENHTYSTTISAKYGNTALDSQAITTNTAAYDAGVQAGTAAGKAAAGLIIRSPKVKLITDGTGASEVVISAAEPTIVYNSTTHKYNVTGKAYADETLMSTSNTISSGTEAYEAGQASVGIRVTMVQNGAVVETGTNATNYPYKGANFDLDIPSVTWPGSTNYNLSVTATLTGKDRNDTTNTIGTTTRTKEFSIADACEYWRGVGRGEGTVEGGLAISGTTVIVDSSSSIKRWSVTTAITSLVRSGTTVTAKAQTWIGGNFVNEDESSITIPAAESHVLWGHLTSYGFTDIEGQRVALYYATDTGHSMSNDAVYW